MKKVKVQFPDGSIVEVDHSDLSNALSGGAKVYSGGDNSSPSTHTVKFADGSTADVGDEDLHTAVSGGATLLKKKENGDLGSIGQSAGPVAGTSQSQGVKNGGYPIASSLGADSVIKNDFSFPVVNRNALGPDPSRALNGIQSRLSTNTTTPEDHKVIAAMSGKSENAVNAYITQGKDMGTAIDVSENTDKSINNLKEGVDNVNHVLGYNFNVDDILSHPDKGSEFLQGIKSVISASKKSDADNKRLLRINKLNPDDADSKPVDTELISSLSAIQNSVAANVKKQTVDEGVTNGLTTEQIGDLIYKRTDPNGYASLQEMRKPKQSSGWESVFSAPALIKNIKDWATGADQKNKETLDYERAQNTIEANRGMRDLATEKMAKGVMSNDDQLKQEAKLLYSKVEDENTIAKQYPILRKQQIADYVSNKIAQDQGLANGTEANNFSDRAGAAFGWDEAKILDVLRSSPYANDPAYKQDIMDIANHPRAYIADNSAFGNMGNSALKPFVSLFNTFGDITGIRSATDRHTETIRDQIFPEVLSQNIKEDASVDVLGHHFGFTVGGIMNSTANLAGYMGLTALTAGAGTELGLAQKGANALGAWGVFGLGAVDEGLKEGDQMGLTPAQSALYASMKGIMMAEGGKIISAAGGIFKKIPVIDKVNQEIAKAVIGITDKSLQQDGAKELINGATNAWFTGLKKFGVHSVEGAGTMSAFGVGDKMLRIAFGDQNAKVEDILPEAANAFASGLLSMGMMGSFGLRGHVEEAKNSTYKSMITRFADNSDAAAAVIRTGLDQGIYDQAQHDQKIKILNTSVAAKDRFESISKENGIDLAPQQRSTWIANRTAEAMLREYADSKDIGEQKSKQFIDQADKLKEDNAAILDGQKYDNFGRAVAPTEASDASKSVPELLSVHDNSPVFQGMKSEEEKLKFISQQAQNVQEDGTVSNLQTSDVAKQSAIRKFGEPLVNAAIEAHPLESLVKVDSKTNDGTGAATQDTPVKHEITVGEMLDKKGSYKGEQGQFVQDGQAIVFKVEGKPKEYELGNVDELKNRPISDFGIQHEESVVKAADNGNLMVRDKEYVNNFSDPVQAINYDKDGSVVSVNMETAKGKKVTFKGNVAEDIAYQIHLKEITKNNEAKDNFEQFINTDERAAQEIKNASLPETAPQETVGDNAAIQRSKLEPVDRAATTEPATTSSDPKSSASTDAVVDKSVKEPPKVKEEPAFKFENTPENKAKVKALPVESQKEIRKLMARGDFETNPELHQKVKDIMDGKPVQEQAAAQGETSGKGSDHAPLEINAANMNSVEIADPESVRGKVIQQVKDVIKSFKSFLPDLKVVVFDTDKQQIAAIGDQVGGSKIVRGAYDRANTVYINLEAVARAVKKGESNNTGYHEGAHPILNALAAKHPELIDKLYKQLESMKDESVQKVLDWASTTNSPKEEAIVEYISKVAAGDIKIKYSNKEAIRNVINKFLKVIGATKQIAADASIADIKEIASAIKKAFRSGTDIKKLIDLSKKTDKVTNERNKSLFPQAQAEKLISDEGSPKFDNLTDVANWIGKWSRKNRLIKGDLGKVSDKKFVDSLVGHTIKELKAWETVNHGYEGFYDEDIPNTLNPKLKEWAKSEHGKELTDSEVSLYHILSSFASPSATPVFDSNIGLQVFDKYLRTGELSALSDKQATEWATNDKGVKKDTGQPKFDNAGNPKMAQIARAYATRSLEKFKSIVDHFGGDVGKAVSWVESKHSYEDMSNMVGTPIRGTNSLKTHENLTRENGGFGIFATSGPKLGSYILNRVGEYSTVTKDLWYARTMARLFGEPLIDSNGEPLSKPWTLTIEGNRKRSLADEAWKKVADELGTTPAVVQQRIWDFERKLWQSMGAKNPSSGKASEGIAKGAEILAKKSIDRVSLEIIKQEGLTVGNFAEHKNLFSGFPYTEQDYRQVKDYLKREGANIQLQQQGDEIRVKPEEVFTAKPNTEAIDLIKKYKEENKIDTPEGKPILTINKKFAGKIADAFESMKDDYNAPEVKVAYDKFIKETLSQAKGVLGTGLKVELSKFGDVTQDYKDAGDMLNDVKNNKHLFVTNSKEAFGQSPVTEERLNTHPMLADSGIKDVNGKSLLVNDVFRFVHDYFGHGERGNDFSPVGEENAWDVHSRMFTDDARRAMTTETRGQNSWINFGKHVGDAKTLADGEVLYPEQKVGLLPEEFSNLREDKLQAQKDDLISGTHLHPHMTEDGKDFVFFHTSGVDKKLLDKGIDSSKQYSTHTSKEEKSKQYGLASFYTQPSESERMVSGEKYQVRVPKKDVYPIDTDPNNYKTEAEKKYPDGTPFREDKIKKAIAESAKQDGFKMVVGEWNYDRAKSGAQDLALRADALVPLKPENKPVDGLQSNSEKGMDIPHPDAKKIAASREVQSVAEDAANHMASKNNYNDAYGLAEDIRVYGGIKEGDSVRPPTAEEINTIKDELPKKLGEKFSEASKSAWQFQADENSKANTEQLFDQRKRENSRSETKYLEDVQKYHKGDLSPLHKFQIGKPTEGLLAAGIPDAPIAMHVGTLRLKEGNHRLSVSEIADIARAVHEPVAVFQSVTRSDSKVVLLDILKNGNNLIAAIEKSRKGEAGVNYITSVHERTPEQVSKWILPQGGNKEGVMEWVDKEKTLKMISANEQRYNSVEGNHVKGITKVVNEFDNPKYNLGDKKSLQQHADDTVLPDGSPAKNVKDLKKFIADQKDFFDATEQDIRSTLEEVGYSKSKINEAFGSPTSSVDGIGISKRAIDEQYGQRFQRTKIGWNDVSQNAMERLRQDAEELNTPIADKARSVVAGMAEEMSKNRLLVSEDRIVTATFHLMNTEERIDELQSRNGNSVESRAMNAIELEKAIDERNAALKVVDELGTRSGRNLGLFAGVFSKNDDGGINIARRRIEGSTGVEIPLTRADWEKMPEGPAKKIAEPYVDALEAIRKAHEQELAKLKAKKATVTDVQKAREKQSKSVRSLADKIRNGDFLDKLGVGKSKKAGDSNLSMQLTAESFTLDVKEGLAKAMEHIADGIDKGTDLEKLMQEASAKFKGENSDADFHGLIKLALDKYPEIEAPVRVARPFDIKSDVIDEDIEMQKRKTIGQLNQLAKRAEDENKTWYNKILDWRRSFLIGGLKSLGRVATSGVSKFTIDPLSKQLFGFVTSKLAGMGSEHTSFRSAGEGVVSLIRFKNNAEAKAFVDKKMSSFEDAAKKLEESNKVLADIGADRGEQSEKYQMYELGTHRAALTEYKKAELENGRAAIYKWINGNGFRDAKDLIKYGTTDFEQAMGGHVKVDSKTLTGGEKALHYIETMNRLHAVLKNPSARRALVETYNARLEDYQKQGVPLTVGARMRALDLAYGEFLSGKYQESTQLNDYFNKRKRDGDKLNASTVDRVMSNFYKVALPVAKVGVNITKAGVDMSTVGVEGIYKYMRAVNRGMELNAQQGKEFNNVYDKLIAGAQSIPEKQKMYIAKTLNRGLFGLSLMLASAWGVSNGSLQYGGEYDENHKAKRKYKGQDGLWHTLDYGEWVIGGHHMGKFGSSILNHLPEFLPVAMVVNSHDMYQYEREYTGVKGTRKKEGMGSAFFDTFLSDVNEISQRLPYKNLLQPVRMAESLISLPVLNDMSEWFDKDKDGNLIERSSSGIGNRTLVNTGLRHFADKKKPSVPNN